MPTPRGPSASLQAHLEAAGVTGCPYCHHEEWEAHAYAHVSFSASPVGDVDSVELPGFPCACLVCQRCGNTAFISLHVTGTVQKPLPLVVDAQTEPIVICANELPEPPCL